MSTKVIDIDAHVAEPITQIMEEYLDPAFKERPMRLLLDEKGLEYVEVDGRKSMVLQGGAGLGLEAGKAFGAEDKIPFFTPGKVHYYDGMIPASNDPHARIEWMDEEGIDVSFMYPTVGLSWEDDCDDPATAAAYCRAYNDWLLDFCKPHPDRLIPIAHIPTRDARVAATEATRTAKLGVKGFMVSAMPPNGRQYGDPYFDPFYAEAEEVGLPVAIHPSGNRDYVGKDLYGNQDGVSQVLLSDYWYGGLANPFALQIALLNLINRGTFDRFPDLKVVFLETGAAWVNYWLERMDDRWESEKHTCKFELRPSEYFLRQCWVSFEPDEKLIPYVIKEVGANKFFWASDFPHHDGFPGVVGRVRASIESLSQGDRDKILSENAVEVYGLG